MLILIATDIHGITAELRSLLAPLGRDAVFVSPWDTDACPYANEQEAVSVFIAQNGIASYAEKIAATAGQGPVFLIGFSVGATAAWVYAAQHDCHPHSLATLFYGSRIRDYSGLIPKIAVTAVFAEQEPSFLPAELAQAIARDPVRASVEPGTLHGFMNPCSAHYAPAACARYLQALITESARHHQLLGATAGGISKGR